MLDWLSKLLKWTSNQSSKIRKTQSRDQPQVRTQNVQSSRPNHPTSSDRAPEGITKALKRSSSPNSKSIIDTSNQSDQSRSAARSTESSASHLSSATVARKSKPQIPLPPFAPTDIWVPPGKSVKVADFLLPGGMVYVGTRIETDSAYEQVDPCLINPKLRIETNRPDFEGNGMGYWPSYSEIPPVCRAAYLEWLANGRTDPDAYIGYVFLFFYGLERRVLRDLQSLKIDASEEVTQISAEVERLLKIYGENNSFKVYASQFLDICRLFQNSEDLGEIQPLLERTAWEVPLSIKIGLGQRANSGHPIPMNWLLSWYLHSEQNCLRTPATRCAKEFQKLLQLKYQEKYGTGIILKANKRRLKVHYRPASSGFIGSNIKIQIDDLPDITAQTGPLNKLKILIDECTNALDPYSRWLGKNSGNLDSKVALALLPSELIEDFEDSDVRDLRQWLAQTLGNNQHINIAAEDLLNRWVSTAAEKLTKKEATTLSQGLGKLGYGIEPDIRFGGKSIKKSSRIVLFKLGSDDITTLSKEYIEATLLLHLAATVAKADDTVDVSEQQHLEEHLESSQHLTETEQVRLRAHLSWLLQEKLSLRGLKNKLGKMTTDEKAGIANFLISVAGADGHIHPKEILTLSKIYPFLGFNTSDIYSHIHNFNTAFPVTSATAPVTVKPALAKKNGFIIPVPPDAEVENEGAQINETPSFELNLETIRQKQTESSKVADLLGEIFEEEEPVLSSSESLVEVEPEFSIADLDTVHSQFLLIIVQQASWDRDGLEIKASNLGLMLDGALEVINDATLELYDEALTDGDNPIEINSDLSAELLP